MLKEIGTVEWNNNDIKNKVAEFCFLYTKRPITNNYGGMLANEMFATWFICQWYKPKLILESGVFKGLGTWFMNCASPKSKIISFDITYKYLKIKIDNVEYNEYDLEKYDWNKISKNFIKNSIVFIDDHVNDITRLKYLNNIGFKKFIFEDNYPPNIGNSFSLRKGFEDIEINKFLNINLKTYYEFPPMADSDMTRYVEDISWYDISVKKKLLNSNENNIYKIFKNDIKNYTYICYVETI